MSSGIVLKPLLPHAEIFVPYLANRPVKSWWLMFWCISMQHKPYNSHYRLLLKRKAEESIPRPWHRLRQMEVRCGKAALTLSLLCCNTSELQVVLYEARSLLATTWLRLTHSGFYSKPEQSLGRAALGNPGVCLSTCPAWQSNGPRPKPVLQPLGQRRGPSNRALAAQSNDWGECALASEVGLRVFGRIFIPTPKNGADP